jgi:hypothetical protein
MLQAKPADNHSVGCLRTVRDRWCHLCEKCAQVSSPEVRLFDPVTLLELNHMDLQASESDDLYGPKKTFYGS